MIEIKIACGTAKTEIADQRMIATITARESEISDALEHLHDNRRTSAQIFASVVHPHLLGDLSLAIETINASCDDASEVSDTVLEAWLQLTKTVCNIAADDTSDRMRDAMSKIRMMSGNALVGRVTG